MSVVSAPVEVTTRYVTSVDTLPEAWAFVMERIDVVGPEPQVHITPRHIMPVGAMIDALEGADDSEERWTTCFEVVVSGMVEEASP